MKNAANGRKRDGWQNVWAIDGDAKCVELSFGRMESGWNMDGHLLEHRLKIAGTTRTS